jgi:hypothetical protein
VKEEVEILEEEFQRTTRSFDRMETIWRTVGDKKLSTISNNSLANGYRSFAYQQADMYHKLLTVANQHWSDAKKLKE